MKSSNATANTGALASQYNDLRSDAYGGSQLLVHQQATPGMTVKVENGVFFLGATQVTYAGGSSSTITAPSANPRIDLVTINSSGTVTMITGTENASPVAPTCPVTSIPLAQIYNVVGETIIYDNANQTAGQGYITDVRPFLQTPSFSTVSNGSLSLNTPYTNTSGRNQLHIVSILMDGATGSALIAEFEVNSTVVSKADLESTVTQTMTILAMVPPGATYEIVTTVPPGTSIGAYFWYTTTF